MTDLVRVARDGSAIIAKVGDSYVTASSSDTFAASSAADLKTLLSSGSWRRPTASDVEKYKTELTLAAGGVVASVDAPAETRTYRVPPTVKRSIADALENFSSLLSDSDREVATRLATRASVDKSDIEWMHRFYSNIEKAFALHGGKRGQAWAAKALSNDSDDTITASAFTYDDRYTYFAGGDDPESTAVDTLYAVEWDEEGEAWDEDSLYVWKNGDLEYVGEADDLDREQLIELDEESAQALATWLDQPSKQDGELFELQDINPIERNLFELANGEIDWVEIDRLSAVIADATGYSPAERRVNAQRQPRASGGKFGGAPAPVGDTLTAYAKARLAEELPLLLDPGARIQEYLQSQGSRPAPSGEEEQDLPIIAAGPVPGEGSPEPLYLAIVDETDRTAVLDALAIVPDESGQATLWKRVDGEWAAANELLEDLNGVTPPPVVELENENVIKDVLAQIDAHDGEAVEAVAASAYELSAETKAGRDRAAKNGYALPDGSFPISTEADLKKAVKAYGRAKDKPAAMRHIKKRARALNRTDLIPEDWKSASLTELFDDSHLTPLYGPYGELIASVVAAGVPGVADTPSDKASVERLYRYWTAGAGAAKIRWGTEGDLTRCHRNLQKYVGPERAWGLCQNYHKRIFGVPNDTRDRAAGER